MSLKSFIKLAISAVMLVVVLRNVDFDELWNTILSISPGIALMVVLGYLLGQFISSFKWWYIARSGGISVPYSTAFKAYFIGMFVNCFGFGIVGGDVMRGILLSHGRPQKTPAIASVVADRLHGLAVLSLIAAISLLAFDRGTLDPSLTVIIAVIIAVIVIGWFVGPPILLRIVPGSSRYRRRIEQLCEVFPREPGTLLVITVLSLVFHLLQIFLHVIMGWGVGVTLSWAVLLTTVPFVNILTSLPISWNGLGVRERGYLHFFSPAILTGEQAVAFGAIWLLAVTVTSAVGGFVALLTKEFEFVSKIETSEEYKALEKQA